MLVERSEAHLVTQRELARGSGPPRPYRDGRLDSGGLDGESTSGRVGGARRDSVAEVVLDALLESEGAAGGATGLHGGHASAEEGEGKEGEEERRGVDGRGRDEGREEGQS